MSDRRCPRVHSGRFYRASGLGLSTWRCPSWFCPGFSVYGCGQMAQSPASQGPLGFAESKNGGPRCDERGLYVVRLCSPVVECRCYRRRGGRWGSGAMAMHKRSAPGAGCSYPEQLSACLCGTGACGMCRGLKVRVKIAALGVTQRIRRLVVTGIHAASSSLNLQRTSFADSPVMCTTLSRDL